MSDKIARFIIRMNDENIPAETQKVFLRIYLEQHL